MATIQDLIDGGASNGYANLFPFVSAKLNFRANILNGDVQRWIVAAIKNITDNYDFEELCTTDAPFVTLTPGQEIYDQTFFMPTSGPFTALTTLPTRFDSFFLQLDQGGAGIELKYRAMKVVKPNSQISGMPVMYTRYGSKVIIAFNPNQQYSVKASMQVKHPIDNNNIPASILYFPFPWAEVIVDAAALIGAGENRMIDKIQELKLELYGDPRGNGEPGLIKSLLSARAQFGNVNERQITMVVGER